MRLHAPLVLPLLLVATLAGCTDDGPDSKDPIVITDPGDYSQLQNQTASQRPHIHDYWGGKEMLTIIDVDEDHTWLVHGSGNGYAANRFRPDAGHIIPLGTQYVDITVTWQEQSSGSDLRWRLGDGPLELWIQTAADEASQPFTQLKNGDTVRFESSNHQNDIPHQVLSAWAFDVMVPDAVDRTVVDGHSGSYDIRFQVLVEAVRGIEIPPSPGHADLWSNQTQVGLLLTGWSYEWAYGGQQRNCNYCSNPPRDIRPDDGAIVPYDADHVEVIVDNDHDTPAGLHLMYHGADTWEWQDAERISEEGTIDRYIIPVDRNGDSPYALQSVWRFGFRIEGDDTNPQSVSAGTFRLEAIVHKEPPT